MTRPVRPLRAGVLARLALLAAGHAVALLALPALAGCGGEYGGAPHAGARAYVPGDRAWRLWYLAPPWVLRGPRGDGVELTIPFNADELLSGGRTTALITLQVEPVAAGTTPAALLAERAAPARAMGAVARYEARPVVMAGGAMGFESAYFGGLGVLRMAAAQLEDGRVVLLTFTSGSSIESDPDIGQMIAEFEPRRPAM